MRTEVILQHIFGNEELDISYSKEKESKLNIQTWCGDRRTLLGREKQILHIGNLSKMREAIPMMGIR